MTVHQWLEFDSHSDFVAGHNLGKRPTAVRLHFARCDGPKVLRSKEIPWADFRATLATNTHVVVIERFEGLDELVQRERFNRFRVECYWTAGYAPIGIDLDGLPRAKTFLEELAAIE